MERASAWVLRTVLAYLAVVWALVVAIDFAQLVARPTLLWWSLFHEAAPTEMLQWLCLAGAVLTAAHLWGRGAGMGWPQAAAYGVLAVGLAVMLLEDAGNIRHRVGRIVFIDLLGHATASSVAKNLFELCFYSALAGLMVWPFLRHGRRMPLGLRAAALLLAGYAAYALAAFTSATRYIGDWYVRAGGAIRTATGAEGPAWDALADELAGRPWPAVTVEFWIMDGLVEETLELIGAGCLLAGLLALAAAQLPASRQRRACANPNSDSVAPDRAPETTGRVAWGDMGRPNGKRAR